VISSPPVATPITPTFVPSSPLDGNTVAAPDVTVNQDTAAAPQNETAIAVDPNNPNVVVAGANDYVSRTWSCTISGTPCSALGDGYSGTYFSTNGGATWCAPIRVNTPTGKPAFTPSVHVSSDGTVGVTYYDFRSLTNQTTTLPTDYWFTSSSNHGASFANEAHLAGPFDMLTAPNAGGFFVGDYEALDTSGTTFKPFFVQANSGNTSNRTDVFATTVTP
jgi:hypothetical protein